MMVHDCSHDSTGGRFPSDATLELLRSSLAGYLAGEIQDEQVCEALAVLAREAQDRQLRAEDMLVAFKRVWNEMPEVEAMSDPADRRRVLGRLVSFCIDRFYQG